MTIDRNLYDSVINTVLHSGDTFRCDLGTEETVMNIKYTIMRATRNSIEAQYVTIETSGSTLIIAPKEHGPSNQKIATAFKAFLLKTGRKK